MKMERIRVTKIDYTPKERQNGAFEDPLKLIIVGVNDTGKRRIIKVSGTKPRFWVTTNPDNVDIPKHLQKYITNIRKEGVAFVTGEPTWCIYVKYPYRSIIKELRDLFDYHCQADVYYHEAVRGFYGIRAYIRVPKGAKECHIGEIEMIEEHAPEVPIKTNDYVTDIETDDELGFALPDHPTSHVTCITLLNKKTKEIYHITTYKVEKKEIEAILQSKEALENLIDHKNPIEPFIGKINLFAFYEGSEEDNERELYECIDALVKKHGITNIEEYTPYDIPYLNERQKVKTKAIVRWNKKHNGNRKYYPRNMFQYVNEYDEEQLYKGFIRKSAKASGKNALSWMGNEEMGYGKINLGKAFHKVMKEDPALLSAYNIWDCVLPDRCLDKCGDLMSMRQSQCNYMASDLNRWSSQMMQWESALMYRLKCEKLLPSIDCVERDKGMEAGGHVEGTPSGLFFNMIELDNSGEYNGVVMSCRISHEALLADGEDPGERPISTLPSGRRYYLDVPAIIPDMLIEMTKMIAVYKKKKKDNKELINQRYQESGGVKTEEIEHLLEMDEIYEAQKYVYKSSSLSSTGLYGTGKIREEGEEKAKRPFRLAHGGFASDITEVARYHEKWNKEWLESHPFSWWEEDGKIKVEVMLPDVSHPDKNVIAGKTVNHALLGKYICHMNVLYQDTDSCKILVEGVIPELEGAEMRDFLYLVGDTYAKYLNKSFDEFAQNLLGIKEHNFLIKVDGVYKKYFQWGRKKHYVWKDYNNDIHYSGVKVKRRDIMSVAKAFMETFFETVMEDKPINETLSDISKLIQTYETEILHGSFMRECGEPHSVKKETLMWDSMKHANAIFDKQFRLGDVGTFYNVRGIIGKPIPKNRKIPLEWTDDPSAFGLEIDFKEVLRKIKQSMKSIIEGLEPGATWESIRDSHARGSFDEMEDELW